MKRYDLARNSIRKRKKSSTFHPQRQSEPVSERSDMPYFRSLPGERPSDHPPLFCCMSKVSRAATYSRSIELSVLVYCAHPCSETRHWGAAWSAAAACTSAVPTPCNSLLDLLPEGPPRPSGRPHLQRVAVPLCHPSVESQ